jgi:hypothetical protein
MSAAMFLEQLNARSEISVSVLDVPMLSVPVKHWFPIAFAATHLLGFI